MVALDVLFAHNAWSAPFAIHGSHALILKKVYLYRMITPRQLDNAFFGLISIMQAAVIHKHLAIHPQMRTIVRVQIKLIFTILCNRNYTLPFYGKVIVWNLWIYLPERIHAVELYRFTSTCKIGLHGIQVWNLH